MNTLDDVRDFVRDVAETLDPRSRYVPELLAIVDEARDVAHLESRLAAGSRGARHAGADVFARMTLEQKLRCNLITNETVLFRFTEGEWEALQSRLIPRFAAGGAAMRVLSAPCSHGEEAFSIAAACLQAGASFSIDAVDVQPACIEAAREGALTMGFPRRWLRTPAIVGPDVMDRIHFAVGDLFREPGLAGAIPLARWDLVVCRNFLGYFREPIALSVATRLAQRVAARGALFLDSFCLGKFAGLEPALRAAGLAREGAHPVFLA